MIRAALRLLASLSLVAIPSLSAQTRAPLRQDSSSTWSSFAEPASTGFGLYFENDLFWDTDQNYTGGMAVSLGGRWVAEAGLTGPLSLLDRVSRMRGVHGANRVSRHTLTVLATAFTPRQSDLGIATPIVDDRPYASLFGFQTRKVSVALDSGSSAAARRAFTSELTIAALGWNLSKAIQTDIHRMRRRRSGDSLPVDPLGWHNQISNGGEPTLLYSVGVEQLLAGPSAIVPGVGGQATWNALASAGYLTNVAAGVTGRWGLISSNFWEFNPNPLSPIQQKLRAEDDRRIRELYGFAAVRGRLVAYNALMQGQRRPSAHEFSARQVERALVEGEAGLQSGFSLFGTITSLRATAALRSPEFEGPRSRSHLWGALHLTISPQ